MLACGNSSASIAMLHDLTVFLEAYNVQRSAVSESSKVPAAAAAAVSKRLGLSHHTAEVPAQLQAAESLEASEAASGATASAALQVLSVLIAHDKACQQVLMQAMVHAKALPEVTH